MSVSKEITLDKIQKIDQLVYRDFDADNLLNIIFKVF